MPRVGRSGEVDRGTGAIFVAGVVTVAVASGDKVDAGQTIATIEAMKMEAAITAPKAGKVSRIAVSATAQVEGGDLLVVVS